MARWDRRSNCYGYAFGIKNWLVLDQWRINAVAELESEFEYIRSVNKADMKPNKEYIALRFADHDFHFMKRGKEGHWRHKPGSTSVKSISEKDVFNTEWYGGYYGRIYLFEVLN